MTRLPARGKRAMTSLPPKAEPASAVSGENGNDASIARRFLFKILRAGATPTRHES
jgi:hypothetical protein